ncbi:MAG: tight adherence protein [Gaiellaceae bacterium]|nr:tight adherence protein [Gaiellaceae bacterium]
MKLKPQHLVYLMVATAYCATAAHAHAATHIRSIDATGYPMLRVTLVAPLASPTPRLTENGRAVVGYGAVNLGRTKSIVLALDRSQSMRGRPIARAVAAAQSFIAGSRADDHVGIVTFGSSAIALTSTGSSPGTARDQLNGVTVDPAAGTALYDAIVLAAQRLAGDDRPGRAIVVVTDGKDVSSLATLQDAIAAARIAHASVFAIGIGGPSFTPSALRRIARETGGSYRSAASTAGLAATYAALRQELARTWSLSYLTAAPSGSKIRLVANVRGKGRVTKTFALPSSSVAAADAPSSVIPAAGYGFLGTVGIGAAVGLLLLLALRFWFAARHGNRLQQRIEPHLGTVVRNPKARRRATRQATRARLSDTIESVLANVKQFKQIQRMIERADLPLRSGELLAGCTGAAFVLGAFSSAVGANAAIALVLAAFGFWAPLGFVSFKARGRVRRFENQLPDLLITLAASLKAGHSFRQGIQSVVEEGAEPAAKEFKRVMTETQLGKPIDDALGHMAERVGSDNFTFVVNAVTIQRQIGGSLAGLFDMVAETVRQRQQFGRKVKSLTAMGRMSAYVLVGLPFFIAGVVSLLNPVYMAPLYHTPLGQKLMIGSVLMIGVGSFMLKRIATFRG